MTLERFHGWNIQLLEEEMIAIERSGDVEDSENIIFVIVASKHRKEGFVFIQQVLLYFKKKITFWKKENYEQNSKWLDSQN